MQRENYRETQLKAINQLPTHRSKNRPTMSQYRIEQLQSLGFTWKVAAPPVGWDQRFQELLEYKRLNGDCNVPQTYPENRPLGRWVMKQRCQVCFSRVVLSISDAPPVDVMNERTRKTHLYMYYVTNPETIL
jgi:hypothetical protein